MPPMTRKTSIDSELDSLLHVLESAANDSINYVNNERDGRTRRINELSSDERIQKLLKSRIFKGPCIFQPIALVASGGLLWGSDERFKKEWASMMKLNPEETSIEYLKCKILEEFGIFFRAAHPDFELRENRCCILQPTYEAAADAIIRYNKSLNAHSIQPTSDLLPIADSMEALGAWNEEAKLLKEDSYPLTEWDNQEKSREPNRPLLAEEFVEIFFPDEYRELTEPIWSSERKTAFLLPMIQHSFPHTSNPYVVSLLEAIFSSPKKET